MSTTRRSALFAFASAPLFGVRAICGTINRSGGSLPVPAKNGEFPPELEKFLSVRDTGDPSQVYSLGVEFDATYSHSGIKGMMLSILLHVQDHFEGSRWEVDLWKNEVDHTVFSMYSSSGAPTTSRISYLYAIPKARV